MTQYFLTVPHDSAEEPTMATMDPAELETVFAAVNEFNAALQQQDAFVMAGGLQPPSTATTVDGSGDSLEISNEPFVEAPEYVGGFWIIEAPDDDAALEWTKRAAQALRGRVEVRAVQEPPD